MVYKGVAYMTKEEIEKLINDKKFSLAIRCFGNDKLRDFIEEIYFDGMRKGYEIAKYTLEVRNLMPYNAADDYLDKHMEDIRDILKLCEQYELCTEKDDN